MEPMVQILDAPPPKAPHLLVRFISDPVVIALVIMMGALTLKDINQVSHSLIFTLKAMLSIAALPPTMKTIKVTLMLAKQR